MCFIVCGAIIIKISWDFHDVVSDYWVIKLNSNKKLKVPHVLAFPVKMSYQLAAALLWMTWDVCQHYPYGEQAQQGGGEPVDRHLNMLTADLMTSQRWKDTSTGLWCHEALINKHILTHSHSKSTIGSSVWKMAAQYTSVCVFML